jgi:hypothetical protein
MPITEIESWFLGHFFLQKEEEEKKKKTEYCVNKVFTIGIILFYAASFTGSFYLQSLMRHLNCIILVRAVTLFVLQFLRNKYLA